jgi:predicted acylesterase/phospholipase RssA
VPANAARGILDVKSNTNRIDMLVLSGGGSHGAWGAGVLRGWRDNERNRRPKRFQVVTGVSTGALLSTFAFLGEPEDDDLLASVYTNVVTADIYRKRFLPLVLFSDSLSSSVPLKHVISRHITSNTLARVAAAGRDGKRGLYVGTVNLDSGKLVI